MQGIPEVFNMLIGWFSTNTDLPLLEDFVFGVELAQ
jgi:hypothetical protein